MHSSTTPTSTPIPNPQQQPAPTASGIKLRIPRRDPRPQFINEEYISFHSDEIGEAHNGYGYDEVEVEVEGRHDMSTYEVQPTGRLVAGSKRVARARENATVGVVAKGFRFGEADGHGDGAKNSGVVGFEGFKSILRTQPDISMGSAEDAQVMKTS